MRDMPRSAERGAHQRVDPDYASTVEIFDNLSHQQIHAAVQQLAPATLLAGQQTWQNTATGLTDAIDQAHTEIRSAIADGWRGGAAQQAAAAVRDFEQLGRQLADVMTIVGQRLGQAGDAAEALRAAVPGPSDAEPDLAAALLDPARASENVSVAKSVEGSRQDVVRVMESIYTSAFIPTGTGIPAFPDAVTGASVEAAPEGARPGPVSIVVPDTGDGRPVGQPSGVSGVVAGGPQPEAPAQPVAAAEEAAEPDAPAPVTIPAAAAPVVPVAPETAPQAPASTTLAAATAPAAAAVPAAPVDRPAAMPVTAPATPVTAPASIAGGPTATANTSPDDQRKREDKRQDSHGSSGDAITGMSAGAMGGLMGGALAAADTTRSGPAPVAAKPAPAKTDEFDDEDDDLHYVDDELTFLEPGGEGGELIGSLDPTTPPVLGEWTEHE
ncbi:PPE domain-containing protein [Nocardia cyriacigeorgica]|uniref:PPE domain-containing protein n=1 Tax=Nocardia cyriacigeorgica TaxID=135487 RepID=UPI003515D95F